MKRKVLNRLIILAFAFLMLLPISPMKSYAKNIDYIPSNNTQLTGITKNLQGNYVLDTKYKQPHQFVVYYGELQYSGISDYSVYDFMVVFDRNPVSVANVRSQGTKIFQYLYFGSRFEDTDEWMQQLKDQIITFKNQGLADGIFLDECDIAYWDYAYAYDTQKQTRFYTRLKELTDYIRSQGMESVVNGTRAFAGLGDYFLWESYLGYWSTNQVKWDATTPTTRVVSNDGAATYGRRFSDWIFEGTVYDAGGYITGGSNGAMETVINLDQFIDPSDQRSQYEWVFMEWFGSGGNDETVSVYAWIGDELPFSENTWEGTTWKKLPELWKGEPESWNGIGKKSKYLKLRIEFNGADNLSIDQILLTFNYNYPYWDMTTPNGDADWNAYMWNYNNSQLNDLIKKQKLSDKSVKVLTHSYGDKNDLQKMRYTLLGTLINDFYAWNYVHPMMQDVTYYDILEEPFGMLLKKEVNGNTTTGYFTGSTASIDTKNNTYSLNRNEPAFYYNRPVSIDGNMSEWNTSDQIYSHTGPAFATYDQFWGAYSSTFGSGTFNNVQVVNRDGFDVLELIEDGIGSWTSSILGTDVHTYKKIMSEMSWNGGGDGTVNYLVQYQLPNGSWTSWSSVSSGTTNPNVDFTAFRVKVELSGNASYTEIDPITEVETFFQGISFWGSSHYWKIYLSDDVNVQGIWINDDSKYLYLRFKVAGEIDFSTNENVLSNNLYNFYIDSDNNNSNGFKGSWWNTSFGAKYRILNNGLYRWKNNYPDQKSDTGWEWVGTTNVEYKKTTGGHEIEYKIKKSNLGGLSAREIKLYMMAEETSTHYGNFVQPNYLDTSNNFTGELIYNQKSFMPKVPHGYIKSEEISVGEGRSASLHWEADTPASTNVKGWVRTRTIGKMTWNDWQEVTSDQLLIGTFDKIQYSIGLYTNDGNLTPEVSNIRLTVNDISKRIEINTLSDQIYNFSSTSLNLSNINQRTFVVKYDPSHLELLDLFGDNINLDIEDGTYNNGLITINKYNPGHIEFKINETIPSDMLWNGNIDAMSFKALKSGISDIKYYSITDSRPNSNKIINGDFEIIENNNPTGWFKANWSNSVESIELVQTPVSSGNYSQKISGSGIPAGSGVLVYQSVQVTPDEYFEISGRFHATQLSNTKVQLYVDFFDSNYGWVGSNVTELNTETSDFTKLSGVGQIPSNASTATVYLILRSTGIDGMGTFYVDWVKFREL